MSLNRNTDIANRCKCEKTESVFGADLDCYDFDTTLIYGCTTRIHCQPEFGEQGARLALYQYLEAHK